MASFDGNQTGHLCETMDQNIKSVREEVLMSRPVNEVVTNQDKKYPESSHE